MMREKPGTDRKQKIVLAAAKVFAAKGAAFVRLNEVAKAAKVPPPLIHYYYKTVEDLHLDVIEYSLNSLRDFSTSGLDERRSPVDNLREYIQAPFHWIERHPDLASIMIYYYYMASFSERFRELNTARRENGRSRIAMMVYRGIEKKLFKITPGESVTDLAYDIQAMITGHYLIFASTQKQRKLAHYVERATIDVLRLLGASE